jgi:hypothetical protein
MKLGDEIVYMSLPDKAMLCFSNIYREMLKSFNNNMLFFNIVLKTFMINHYFITLKYYIVETLLYGMMRIFRIKNIFC